MNSPDRLTRPKPGWWWAILLICLPLLTGAAGPTTPPPAPQLLETAYSGGESFHYTISWQGLLKTGELFIRVERLDPAAERFAISVLARSAGLLAFFYPIEDRFETIVEGPHRLPVRLAMDQQEGSRQNRKLTIYRQGRGEVAYSKNEEPPQIFPIEGPVHNEFSSLFILRTLPLEVGKEVVVPTFADRKRHQIRVAVQEMETVDSLFGPVSALRVEPQLNFKGLYEKAGSPQIWLTADRYRIPLRIKSKIKIGSLVAELVAYDRAEPTGEAPGSPPKGGR